MKQQGRAISSISFPKGAPAPQTISAELPKASQCPAELLVPHCGCANAQKRLQCAPGAEGQHSCQWQGLLRMWCDPFRCCLSPSRQMCPHLEWCHFCCVPVPARQALNKCWDFLTGDHLFRLMQCLTSSASFLLLSWMLLPISFCLRENIPLVSLPLAGNDTLLHCLLPLEAESCDSLFETVCICIPWVGWATANQIITFKIRFNKKACLKIKARCSHACHQQN